MDALPRSWFSLFLDPRQKKKKKKKKKLRWWHTAGRVRPLLIFSADAPLSLIKDQAGICHRFISLFVLCVTSRGNFPSRLLVLDLHRNVYSRARAPALLPPPPHSSCEELIFTALNDDRPAGRPASQPRLAQYMLKAVQLSFDIGSVHKEGKGPIRKSSS